MKRVLFSAEVETIALEKISDTLHIGMLLSDNVKAHIVKAKEGFFAMAPFQKDITMVWYATSKFTYLRDFKPEPQAFVFGTEEALINWLKS